MKKIIRRDSCWVFLCVYVFILALKRCLPCTVIAANSRVDVLQFPSDKSLSPSLFFTLSKKFQRKLHPVLTTTDPGFDVKIVPLFVLLIVPSCYLRGSLNNFPDFFFVWALLLIVHTWNSSPLRSNLLLQCTCCIVPKTSGRPHGSPLMWACQRASSQPLWSLQLTHIGSLWA